MRPCTAASGSGWKLELIPKAFPWAETPILSSAVFPGRRDAKAPRPRRGALVDRGAGSLRAGNREMSQQGFPPSWSRSPTEGGSSFPRGVLPAPRGYQRRQGFYPEERQQDLPVSIPQRNADHKIMTERNIAYETYEEAHKSAPGHRTVSDFFHWLNCNLLRSSEDSNTGSQKRLG